MEVLFGPAVEERDEIPTLGIRLVTPFRGMLKVRDELLDELDGWVVAEGIDVGPAFLRLHVIDMDGPMDIEVGVLARSAHVGDERVRPGSIQRGRYATLRFRDHALRANKLLIGWARDRGLTFDRADVPEGDRFACRYEAYLTDRASEPRRTRWETELAIRLADGP